MFAIGREELRERSSLFRDRTGESRPASMLAQYDGLERLAVIAVHVSAADYVRDDLVHEALERRRVLRVQYHRACLKGRL